ncbi:MAG: hypothetical protein MJ016_00930 [Victivallaceae bacterium]|nr:hypothetical protein [Victivallaceae bacterium]
MIDLSKTIYEYGYPVPRLCALYDPIVALHLAIYEREIVKGIACTVPRKRTKSADVVFDEMLKAENDRLQNDVFFFAFRDQFRRNFYQALDDRIAELVMRGHPSYLIDTFDEPEDIDGNCFFENYEQLLEKAAATFSYEIPIVYPQQSLKMRYRFDADFLALRMRALQLLKYPFLDNYAAAETPADDAYWGYHYGGESDPERVFTTASDAVNSAKSRAKKFEGLTGMATVQIWKNQYEEFGASLEMPTWLDAIDKFSGVGNYIDYSFIESAGDGFAPYGNVHTGWNKLVSDGDAFLRTTVSEVTTPSDLGQHGWWLGNAYIPGQYYYLSYFATADFSPRFRFCPAISS